MYRLITHIVIAIAAFLVTPQLIDAFADSFVRLSDPITAVVVALTLIPAIKPIFD